MKFEDLNRMISTDQTGLFLITSSRGNYYVVIENIDAGLVLTIGIKSQKKEYLVEEFITIPNTLKAAGINSVLHQINRKYLVDLIYEIKSKRLEYKIAPPVNHRALPTERVIQTFETHFQFILYGYNPVFPKNQYITLIDVGILVLNMIRSS